MGDQRALGIITTEQYLSMCGEIMSAPNSPAEPHKTVPASKLKKPDPKYANVKFEDIVRSLRSKGAEIERLEVIAHAGDGARSAVTQFFGHDVLLFAPGAPDGKSQDMRNCTLQEAVDALAKNALRQWCTDMKAAMPD